MFKRFFILFLCSCSCIAIHAQNLLYADARPFHFGFSLGINMMDCAVTPSLENINGEIYQVRESSLMPGFSVGVLGDMRISNHLNLRTVPTLHFGQRTLYYKPQSAAADAPESFKTDVISLPITIPLYLKFSANREHNYRPYIIGGGGVSFDLGRNMDKPVLLKTLDYYAEFGVGCDIYFSFFKLAPELKFAIGFNDLITPVEERPELKNEDKIYTQSISRLTSRMLTLVFHFE